VRALHSTWNLESNVHLLYVPRQLNGVLLLDDMLRATGEYGCKQLKCLYVQDIGFNITCVLLDSDAQKQISLDKMYKRFSTISMTQETEKKERHEAVSRAAVSGATSTEGAGRDMLSRAVEFPAAAASLPPIIMSKCDHPKISAASSGSGMPPAAAVPMGEHACGPLTLMVSLGVLNLFMPVRTAKEALFRLLTLSLKDGTPSNDGKFYMFHLFTCLVGVDWIRIRIGRHFDGSEVLLLDFADEAKKLKAAKGLVAAQKIVDQGGADATAILIRSRTDTPYNRLPCCDGSSFYEATYGYRPSSSTQAIVLLPLQLLSTFLKIEFDPAEIQKEGGSIKSRLMRESASILPRFIDHRVSGTPLNCMVCDLASGEQPFFLEKIYQSINGLPIKEESERKERQELSSRAVALGSASVDGARGGEIFAGAVPVSVMAGEGITVTGTSGSEARIVVVKP